jgi:hypothetical protein
MEITASNTKDFNWKMGLSLGVDVASIFEHPIVAVFKYRVIADPKVNVREKPDSTSKDIGDKLYLQIVMGERAEGGWVKLVGEPGYISSAWLEEV